VNYWPLLGVGVVVLGFAARLNPVLVVVAAGVTSAIAAKMAIPDMLTLFGQALVGNRSLLLFVLTLPVIGVLERAGLREHAHDWIGRIRTLTFSRFLIAYLALRQMFSMLGLTHIAGHAQTVRPLIAPMAEAVAERSGELSTAQREKIRALAAATDNVGYFFGEDVWVAIGAVLLIQGYFAQVGIVLEPIAIAPWAIPTAIAAFAIHATRLWLWQRYNLRGTPRSPVDVADAKN
jgi:uncharacterized membrane protein